MKKIIILIMAAVTVFAGSQSTKIVFASPVDALAVAHELDETVFCDWTYGSYSSVKKQLDCTTFISAVVDSILSRQGFSYTNDIRQDVLIDHNDLDRDVVTKGPDKKDPRYGGVVYAMVKHQFGIQISDMSQVRPGDFIQYWKQNRNGTWFGHASLIESVAYDEKKHVYKAKIFGSHKSTDGIAVSNFELYLSGNDRVVYIGRIR